MKDIDHIIHQLSQAQQTHSAAVHPCMGAEMLGYPSVRKFVGLCREILFPGYFGEALRPAHKLEHYLAVRLDKARTLLANLALAAFCFDCRGGSAAQCAVRDSSEAAADDFAASLPALSRTLLGDVEAIYKIDPAAQSADEIIFAYPGLRAIISHRIAHQLWGQGVPLLPRMISEIAHSGTGIDIHPATPIGERFAIDHGTGTVVGSTAVIGNNVTIYQGVTLGAKRFSADPSGKALDIPRHPIVEDDVTIYAGAKLIGRITIGRGSVIGGNVWLTESVPPYSKIVRTPF